MLNTKDRLFGVFDGVARMTLDTSSLLADKSPLLYAVDRGNDTGFSLTFIPARTLPLSTPCIEIRVLSLSIECSNPRKFNTRSAISYTVAIYILLLFLH